MSALAPKLGFEVKYLPKLEEKGGVISTSRIRALLAEGNIKEAELLLGRPLEDLPQNKH